MFRFIFSFCVTAHAGVSVLMCSWLPCGGACIMCALLLQSSSHPVRADVDFHCLWASIGTRLRSCRDSVTMGHTTGADGGRAITFRSLAVTGITSAVSFFWEVRVRVREGA